jgi:hypothetical protein
MLLLGQIIYTMTLGQQEEMESKEIIREERGEGEREGRKDGGREGIKKSHR